MRSRKRPPHASNESFDPQLGPTSPQLFKTPPRSRVQCPNPSVHAVMNTVPLHEFKDYAEIPMSEKRVEQMHQSSSKIKLQLFPIDERTRVGLERDGFHPYLELVLHARKKITSVLTRLNSKWGSSSVAKGEPFLFPYYKSETLTSCGWSMNDTDANAGDVYASIGKPSVFRLRYGWFSDSGVKSFKESSESVNSVKCLQPEVEQKGNSAITDCIHGVYTETNSPVENFKTALVDGAKDAMCDRNPSNGSVKPLVRADVGVAPASALWDDSLTNISIGGLLSEASLQGRFNTFDSNPRGSSMGIQPSQLITDSFDAFIAAQMNNSEVLRPTTHGSVSSILDAEDTCHAFAFPKISCSDENVAATNEGISKGCDQGGGSELFNHPLSAQINAQSSSPQGHNFRESDADITLTSRVYNNESSLGLSGIKWCDSLSPFDLGLSSSRRIISSDSLSLSKILSKQTDS